MDSRSGSAEEVFKLGGSLQLNFINAANILGFNFLTFSLPATPNGIAVAASHRILTSLAGVKEFRHLRHDRHRAGAPYGWRRPLVGAGTISSIINAPQAS